MDVDGSWYYLLYVVTVLDVDSSLYLVHDPHLVGMSCCSTSQLQLQLRTTKINSH